MKQFIELTTEEGKVFININSTSRIAEYDDKDGKYNSIIWFLSPSKNVPGCQILYVFEKYDEIKTLISQSL